MKLSIKAHLSLRPISISKTVDFQRPFFSGIEQAIYDYDYEALEDIWLKAGEMEPEDATYAPDVGYQTRFFFLNFCLPFT